MSPPTDLQVEDKVQDGVAVITVSYGPETFQQSTASSNFSSEILRHYDSARQQDSRVKSAVVDIHADVAGSSLVRGLFELFRAVLRNGGQIVCVGFPKDYLPSLTTLGLLDQPRFSLADNPERAIRQLKS